MKRILLVTVILLGVALRIIASQPNWMNGDENYYINIYQNYVDRGQLTPYMWRIDGDANIIAGAGTGYGIFVVIGWLALVGESLFGLRMLMVLSGFISAGLYYLISKMWWQSREAGIASMVYGLVSTSPFFTLVGRMDAVAILTYSLLLLLHITAVRQGRRWLHLVVGAVAILTVEFHVLGLLYLGALAFYHGIEYLQLLLKERKFKLDTPAVYFYLGAGLFGVLYIVVHILPDPEAYFVIPNTCTICKPGRIQSETFRIIKMFIYRPHEIILAMLVVYSGIRHWKSSRHFLLVFFGYLLAQIIVSPPHYIQYSHHLIPLLAIGVGGFVVQLISRTTRKDALRITLLVASLVLLAVNFVLPLMGWFPYENSVPIPDLPEIGYIQEHIPPSTVVMSNVSTFYPLKEYRNFLDYSDQIKYGLMLRGESRAAFYERVNPEVILLREEIVREDSVLQQYVDQKDFVRVTSNLLVTRELLPDE